MVVMVMMKDRVQKVRGIDQQVWSSELTNIRQVVDEELKAIRQMSAGLFAASEHSYLSNDLDTRHQDVDADSDDDFDVDSVKLKLANTEDNQCSPIPELYLAQSPVVDGGQSLSWYVFVVFML